MDVTAGYFEMLEMPLLHGRAFEELDTFTDNRVVIVSERLAQALWGGRNALGQRVTFQATDSMDPPRWFGVIGVVGDVDSPLNSGGYARPAAYLPLGPTGLPHPRGAR